MAFENTFPFMPHFDTVYCIKNVYQKIIILTNNFDNKLVGFPMHDIEQYHKLTVRVFFSIHQQFYFNLKFNSALALVRKTAYFIIIDTENNNIIKFYKWQHE